MLLIYEPPCTNLDSLLPHEAGRIGVLNTNGISRLTAIFLCKKYLLHIIMSNWIGQLKNWVESFVPLRQSCTVRLHNWRYVVEFITLQTTEAVMPKQFHAQIPTKHNTPILSVRLKSFFYC